MCSFRRAIARAGWYDLRSRPFNRSSAHFKGGKEIDLSAMKAIGTMSGTSMDGVDVALIETDGERILSLGPSGYRPYSEAERGTLRQALSDAVQMTARDQRPGAFGLDESVATEAHRDAVRAFIVEHRI